MPVEQEKPLHVRVAEALGWVRMGPCSLLPPERCSGTGVLDGQQGCVKNYDTDWAATGPLIEKYRIYLQIEKWGSPSWPMWMATYATVPRAEEPDVAEYDLRDIGPTPLIAVCRLLIALAAAGKLK